MLIGALSSNFPIVNFMSLISRPPNIFWWIGTGAIWTKDRWITVILRQVFRISFMHCLCFFIVPLEFHANGRTGFINIILFGVSKKKKLISSNN